MQRSKLFVCLPAVLLFVAVTLTAQSVPSGLPRPGAPASTNSTGARRTGQKPCWQQVGVSQSAEQRRRQIEQGTRSQVEAVCADSSLTPQQKQEKIRELHANARREVEGLMSPQQQEAMKSCREQRGEGGGVGHGGHGGGGEGPCGEMPMGTDTKP